MKRDKNFHDYVVYDILVDFDGVTSKPLFSGWGIYLHGRIFAFIIGSEFYLKGNDKTSKIFEKEGGKQFTYKKKSHPEPIKLPYWSVPEDVLEDRELLSAWINLTSQDE